MKSLSAKLGVVLFITGLAIFGNIEVWGAECAWVLWEKEEMLWYKGQPPESEWKVIGAVPKFEQCEELQKQVFLKQKAFYIKKDSPWKLFIDNFPTHMNLTYGEAGQKFINLYCLPDTIDPRK